jgi:hypothetical protein
MKSRFAIAVCLLAAGTCAPGAVRTASAVTVDEWLDQLDETLSFSSRDETVRARVSGAAELEYYAYSQPPPGLIESAHGSLLNPRFELFLDAQIGPELYFFAQARADRGFDPADEPTAARVDEYALRYTPYGSHAFNIQIGKFATVAGNWVARHQAWDNPFVTAPVPYESPTGIFDSFAARSPDALLFWSHVRPAPAGADPDLDHYRVPLLWGPSYASGAAVLGEAGKWDYAFEFKNASLSSRPAVWNPARRQWQHPTVTARIGWRPDERWNLGFSASGGAYLRDEAARTLAPGSSLSDYRQTVLGQDLGFAWHHVQLWAECYEARFEIPRVGDADTVAYYIETKYKFTPQFFGALRWNQQLFGRITDSRGERVRWGRDLWRIDLAGGYRFSTHTQWKVQYSLERGRVFGKDRTHLLATQFVIRF